VKFASLFYLNEGGRRFEILGGSNRRWHRLRRYKKTITCLFDLRYPRHPRL